jgi:hypothetical protein
MRRVRATSEYGRVPVCPGWRGNGCRPGPVEGLTGGGRTPEPPAPVIERHCLGCAAGSAPGWLRNWTGRMVCGEPPRPWQARRSMDDADPRADLAPAAADPSAWHTASLRHDPSVPQASPPDHDPSVPQASPPDHDPSVPHASSPGHDPSVAQASPPDHDPDGPPLERKVRHDIWVLGLTVGVFGASFGVLATTAGLTAAQACAMSVLVFTGASQFAVVGVIGSGGSLGSALGRPCCWRPATPPTAWRWRPSWPGGRWAGVCWPPTWSSTSRRPWP